MMNIIRIIDENDENEAVSDVTFVDYFLSLTFIYFILCAIYNECRPLTTPHSWKTLHILHYSIDFLVRDWQNFDMDWEDAVEEAQGNLVHPKDSAEGKTEQYEAEAKVYAKFRKEMSSYLESVIRTRKAEDLQSTREQIAKCYEKVGCFLLPHPGMALLSSSW